MNSQTNHRWVLTVYLMQGVPFAIASAVSPILFKDFGFSNSLIAFYTSLFILPWIFKFFFAPAFEKTSAKRAYTVGMQFLMAIFVLLIAINIYFSNSFYVNCLLFLMLAFAGSIHDINSDGLYLEALNYQTQASMIGIRSICYQIGKLLCQGGLIYGVGFFIASLGKTNTWSIAFALLALGILLAAAYNKKILSDCIPLNTTADANSEGLLNAYKNVLKEFRDLTHLVPAVIFIFVYNFPEVQILKIFPLFMLDKTQVGGLGLGIDYVGILFGVIGVGSMLLGITLSGFILARVSLRKSLVPFTIFATVANLSYLLLAILPSPSIWLITTCVIVGQLGYGLSNGAYMLYLINIISKKHYTMSLYAIGTAIMLLGNMIAGSFSGYLQSILGYPGFFTWIIFAGVGMTLLALYNARKVL